MAWGYGSDPLSMGLCLCLLLQGGVLLWLLGSSFRGIAADRSAWTLAFGGVGVVLVMAGLLLASPSFGVGVTSGLLTLFVLIPASVANGILFAWRGWPSRAPNATRWPLLLPLVCDLVYWSREVLAAHGSG
jgi:hypothetical protein